MNYHIALVHFPVALLTIYALLEIFRFPFLNKRPAWREVKFVFLLLGTIGSYASFQTGLLIAPDFLNKIELLMVHGRFADFTVKLFTVLTLCYTLRYAEEKWRFAARLSGGFLKAYNLLLKIVRFFTHPVTAVILAVVGLALITITGALGGAIAYGPDVDPVAKFVYGLFF